MTFLETGKLAGMLDRFQQTAIKTAPERCLNRRHKDSNCALCQACPTGAITVAAMSVTVNAEKCVGCGLCSSRCPTEVFTVQGPDLAEVLRLCAGARGAALEVACPRRSPLEKSRSSAAAVLRLSCLAWLSPALLVAIQAQGVTSLWLDDSPCAECPISDAHEVIARAVETANRLLGLMGRQPAVFLYTGRPEGLGKARNLVVWDPIRPVMSRRDLFTAFRRVATQTAATVADQALPGQAQSKLPQRIPAQRALLSAALPRLLAKGAPVGDLKALPLASVSVSSACTACGLCGRVCPTGALAFAQDDVNYSLAFLPLRCLGSECRVCRLICPVDAVTLVEEAAPSSLVDEQPILLRAGKMTVCSRCGAPTAAPSSGAAVCHACRWTTRLGVQS